MGKLMLRNLLHHPLRSLLTIGSLVIAIFLLCALRSVVTTLERGVVDSKTNRLNVQSAVSLMVELPLAYQAKIESVEGVDTVGKWQWFGGYFETPKKFFAQFAVDPETLLATYPECEIVEGSLGDFLGDRTACLIGKGLSKSKKFGWKVGDTVPVIPTIFPHPDGPDKAWEFRVAAIYESSAPNFDENTLFFHWKLFEETLAQTDTGVPGVGVYVVKTEPDVSQTKVMAQVDALFENGPQVVQTTTDSEFASQFVSMMGNVPFFVSTIGGAVLIAILLACLNTMLMAAREQTRDLGILKAMGFTDRSAVLLLLGQSLVLCGLGGLLGMGLAYLTQPMLEAMMGTNFPGYAVLPSTFLLAAIVTVALGLLSGLAPAWFAGRLKTVEALGARE